MPISKSGGGGGVRVDKSACIPFGTPAGTIALTTVYQTLQSITGKGFLDIVVLWNNLGINSLRITIDGVVKFEATSSAAGYFVGVTKRDLLLPVATSTTVSNLAVVSPISPNTTTPISVSNNVGFPYTANTLQNVTLSIVADSIFFNSSLLIEVKGSTAHSDYYYLHGGYQQ